jgi:hypothetical protein
MPDKTLTIMGVHGLGGHSGSDWAQRWADAVTEAFPVVEGVKLDFKFVTYDDIFDDTNISLWDIAQALWKLGWSGVSSIGRRERGVVSTVTDRIRWTAGYVVAWVEDDKFQRRSRKRILEAVAKHKPDIILAHSLGSLVTYNAFAHSDATKAPVAGILSNARYVTLGSQIGNPFVVGNLTNGRIRPLAVRFWHHLYNRHDNVFTAEIRLWEMPNFSQTDTPFDIDGVANHAAESYLGHRSTIENVWRPAAEQATGARAFGPAAAARQVSRTEKPTSTRRALLVGINEYPNPGQRLEGCVNDVFLMSSVLQECGFKPDEIRVCLDDRATTQGILDRLDWLLDSPKADDELVFYYSGHGARIPEYGLKSEPDHYVETLVPWDFDWSPEHRVADRDILNLYSQLPYDCRFTMILDCCHSGGLHRDGGPRPRGIAPPDDIRHRELKWDTKTQMWVSRDFRRLNEEFTTDKDVAKDYFGPTGATERLGRSGMLRTLTQDQYRRLKKADGEGPKGPYLPLILEACDEEQFSYEYRHGAVSYGAFTFSLVAILRRQTQPITFEELIEKTRRQLIDLRYEQTPRVLGPTMIVEYPIPWYVPAQRDGA